MIKSRLTNQPAPPFGGMGGARWTQIHILSAESSSHELFLPLPVSPPPLFLTFFSSFLPLPVTPPPTRASSHPRCVVYRMPSSVGTTVCLLAVALVGLFPQPAGGQGRYLLCPTSNLRVLQGPRGHSGDPQPAHRASRAGV